MLYNKLFNKILQSEDILSKGGLLVSKFSLNIFLFFSSIFSPIKGGLDVKRKYMITPHDHISLLSKYLFEEPIASGGV